MAENCTSTSQSLRNESAKRFLESIENNDYYLFTGRSQEWASEASPPTSVLSTFDINDVWDNMIMLKKITAADFSLVAARIDWEDDTAYEEYTDTDDIFTPPNFYVLTDSTIASEDNLVFKCLFNNSDADSTLQPSTTQPGKFSYIEDGYIWTLLYQISGCDTNFITDDWIPVKTLTESDTTLHWDAQQYAVDGSIQVVKITDPGAGYTDGTYTLDIDTLESDGSGFVGEVTVASGVITDVTVAITTEGQDYTRLSLSMPSSAGTPGTVATFDAMISPKGGHGSDAVEELLPNAVMIYIKVESTDSNITNDYRQYGIVVNPTLSDSNNVNKTTYSQTTDLNVIGITGGTGAFTIDEQIYVGTTLGDAITTAYVVDWNATTNILKVATLRGIDFTINNVIHGNTSVTTAMIDSIDNPEFLTRTGDTIYLVNRTKITRNEDQQEEYKIVFKF